jgi:hypothetical protein
LRAGVGGDGLVVVGARGDASEGGERGEGGEAKHRGQHPSFLQVDGGTTRRAPRGNGPRSISDDSRARCNQAAVAA